MHFSGPTERPLRREALVVTSAAVASAFAILIADTQYVLLTAGLVGTAIIATLPQKWLIPIAIILFVAIPIQFIGTPVILWSITPAVVVLAIHAMRVRELWAEPSKKWLLPIAAIGICAILSSVSSGSITPRQYLWLVAFIIPMAIATAPRSVHAKYQPLAIKTWALAAIAAALFSFIEFHGAGSFLTPVYSASGYTQHWSEYRVAATFGHPLMAATFFSVSAAFFFLKTVLNRHDGNVAWLPALTSLLSTIALLLTVSRGGLFALIAGLTAGAISLLFHRPANRRLQLIILLTLSATLVLVAGSQLIGSRDSSSEGVESADYRLTVLARALPLVGNAFLLGTGPASSQSTLQSAGSSLVLENSLLQIILSLGVLGFIAVAASFFVILRRAHQTGSSDTVAAVVAFVMVSASFNAWESTVSIFALVPLVVICGSVRAHPSIK